MMQTVRCPNQQCGKSYNVSEESLGGRARCKACGSVFELKWGGDESNAANRRAERPSESQRPPASQISKPNPAETIQLSDTQVNSLDAPHQSQTPTTLGRFQIRSVLGAGTFGTVYRAHDPQLDREVAIKVPNVGVLRTGEEAERFLREARAAASLRHANICPVYEATELDGRYCIVMAFIAGKTLSSLINPDKPLSEQQTVALVQKLAQALELAHQKGVVHRDLKPGNIMFDQESREPVIMDFGLARRTSDVQMTQVGQILGTPAYMSPEQALGQTEIIGTASDVYSLGVIFYELLCLQRPFPGSAEQVRAAHYLNTEPEPPSTHRTGIDPTLEAICMKAMSRKIADRLTMAEIATALTHYVPGRQPSAGVLPPELPAHDRLPATTPAVGDRGLSVLFSAIAADDKKPAALRKTTEKHRRQPASRKNDRRALPPAIKWAGGAGTAALLFLLGVVLFMKTDKGFVKIEIVDPSLTVTVADNVVTVDNDGKLLSLKVGTHKLIVEYEGLEVPFEDSFEIKKNLTVALRVTRANGNILILNEGDELPIVAAPAKTAVPENAALPAASAGSSIVTNETMPKAEVEPIASPPTQTAPPAPLAIQNQPATLDEWAVSAPFGNSQWSIVAGGDLQGGGDGWLATKEDYSDFEISLEYQLPRGGNSGVFVRATPAGNANGSEFLEIQLLDDNSSNTRIVTSINQTGSLWNIASRKRSLNTTPNQWHKLQVRAVGSRIQVEHDGIDALDVNLDSLAIPATIRRQASGRIGLQSLRTTGIRFRNIVIRDLKIATSMIPDGAEPFENHSYKFFGEELAWKEAKARCESLSGNLVIIDSMEENRFVADLVAAADWQDAWIGITDEAQEGTWTTVTGQPLAMTNWFPGQPNNKGVGGEHFGLMSNRNAGESIAWRWSDQPNRNLPLHQPGYICEWDPTPPDDNRLGAADPPTPDPPPSPATAAAPEALANAALQELEKKIFASLVKIVVPGERRNPLGVVTDAGICTIMPGSFNDLSLESLDGKQTFAGMVASRKPFPFCWIESAALNLPPVTIANSGAASKPQDVFVVLRVDGSPKLIRGKIDADGSLSIPAEVISQQSGFISIGPTFAEDGSCLGISTRSDRDKPITIRPIKKE